MSSGVASSHLCRVGILFIAGIIYYGFLLHRFSGIIIINHLCIYLFTLSSLFRSNILRFSGCIFLTAFAFQPLSCLVLTGALGGTRPPALTTRLHVLFLLSMHRTFTEISTIINDTSRLVHLCLGTYTEEDHPSRFEGRDPLPESLNECISGTVPVRVSVGTRLVSVLGIPQSITDQSTSAQVVHGWCSRL